jgi:hypothetical protein
VRNKKAELKKKVWGIDDMVLSQAFSYNRGKKRRNLHTCEAYIDAKNQRGVYYILKAK